MTNLETCLKSIKMSQIKCFCTLVNWTYIGFSLHLKGMIGFRYEATNVTEIFEYNHLTHNRVPRSLAWSQASFKSILASLQLFTGLGESNAQEYVTSFEKVLYGVAIFELEKIKLFKSLIRTADRTWDSGLPFWKKSLFVELNYSR